MISSIFLVQFAACTPKPPENRDVKFLNSTIHMSTLEEAQNLLSTSDEFTQTQSPFDYASKTQNVSSTSEQDYLAFAKENAKEWSESDIAKTKNVIQEAETKIKALGLKISLPKTISLIKSACGEEGGAAGYTRQDYIVVSSVPNEHLFLHELFHIISRHDPILRNALYQTIAFQPCQRIEYPASLKDRKITNPDAPFFDNYIPVNIDGESKDVIIVTLASRAYDGGSFFQYLELKLMELEGNAEMKKAKIVNGEPILYDFSNATDLVQKIGTNTNYTIHPEEILAEHFTMMVTNKEVNDQKFIDDITAIFKM